MRAIIEITMQSKRRIFFKSISPNKDGALYIKDVIMKSSLSM